MTKFQVWHTCGSMIASQAAILEHRQLFVYQIPSCQIPEMVQMRYSSELDEVTETHSVTLQEVKQGPKCAFVSPRRRLRM